MAILVSAVWGWHEKIDRQLWLNVIVRCFKSVYFDNLEDAMQIETNANLSTNNFIGDKLSDLLICQVVMNCSMLVYWFTKDNKTYVEFKSCWIIISYTCRLKKPYDLKKKHEAFAENPKPHRHFDDLCNDELFWDANCSAKRKFPSVVSRSLSLLLFLHYS